MKYALSHPASVVIHGIAKMEYLNQTLATVKNFHPDAGAARCTYGQSKTGGPNRRIRTVHDHPTLQFHRQESGMARVAMVPALQGHPALFDHSRARRRPGYDCS